MKSFVYASGLDIAGRVLRYLRSGTLVLIYIGVSSILLSCSSGDSPEELNQLDVVENDSPQNVVIQTDGSQDSGIQNDGAATSICSTAASLPEYVYRIDRFLRFYPTEALASANSLERNDIFAGLSDTDGHIVYANEPVSSENKALRVLFPVWMQTDRLDFQQQTTGNIAGSIGRVFNASNPSDASVAMSGGFIPGANNRTVQEFGCTVGAFTLTYVYGYLYRATQLPAYLTSVAVPSVENTTNQIVDPTAPSDPEFNSNIQQFNFDDMRLYSGHLDNTEGQIQLDPFTLASGELITVEVLYDGTEFTEQIGIELQLLPQDIFSRLSSGETLQAVTSALATNADGTPLTDSDTITLGIGNIITDQDGPQRVVFKVKLPVLNTEENFKLAAVPVVTSLTSKEKFSPEDLLRLPVLIDERILSISQLEQPHIDFVASNSDVQNEFIELEDDAAISEQGFTIEPIFSTSVSVDVATFAEAEEVVITATLERPDGTVVVPMGVYSTDSNGTPIVSTEARFQVSNNGTPSTVLPVVIHATDEALNDLRAKAISLREIANTDPANAIFRIIMTRSNSSGSDSDELIISAPILRAQARARQQLSTSIADFKVLRAGITNDSCLDIIPDVDSGTLGNPSDFSTIIMSDCGVASLWRYDSVTKQIIAKARGSNDESFCITVTDGSVLQQDGNSFERPSFVRLTGCRNEGELDRFGRPIQTTPGSSPSRQHFEFDEQRIRMVTHPAYLNRNVSNNTLGLTYELNSASDFYNDGNGLDISDDGKLFSIGKQYPTKKWGIENIAQVKLAYGGESYVSYLPVIGVVAQGNLSLSADLFTKEVSLIDASFALKRHLPKRLSITGSTYPETRVQNGASIALNIVNKEVFQAGSLEQVTVSDSFTDELVSEVLNSAELPDFDQKYEKDVFKMDHDFPEGSINIFGITITVGGGVKGDVDIGINLSTPDIGIRLASRQSFSLSGYGVARLNAYIVAAGLEGEVELINQSVVFGAGGAFAASQQDATSLAFSADADMTNRLQILKGKLSAFYDYVSGACVFSCFPPEFEFTRKRTTIYESDYLLNNTNNVFNSDIASTIIDY